MGDPFPRCGDPQPEGWDEPDHEYVDVYHLVKDGGSWKVDDWTPSEATSDDSFS